MLQVNNPYVSLPDAEGQTLFAEEKTESKRGWNKQEVSSAGRRWMSEQWLCPGSSGKWVSKSRSSPMEAGSAGQTGFPATSRGEVPTIFVYGS